MYKIDRRGGFSNELGLKFSRFTELLLRLVWHDWNVLEDGNRKSESRVILELNLNWQGATKHWN